MRLAHVALRKLATDDGLMEMEDSRPIGSVYLVDLDSVCEQVLLHLPTSTPHKKVVVMVHEPGHGWLATELLEMPLDA